MLALRFCGIRIFWLSALLMQVVSMSVMLA